MHRASCITKKESEPVSTENIKNVRMNNSLIVMRMNRQGISIPRPVSRVSQDGRIVTTKHICVIFSCGLACFKLVAGDKGQLGGCEQGAQGEER